MKPVQHLSEPRHTGFPREWYDAAHRQHFWLTSRERAFCAMLDGLGIDTRQEIRVMDVGTGNGAAAALIEADTAWTVDGVDLEERAFATAQQRRGRLFGYDITLRKPDMAGSFDAAVLFDVIEHVQDPVPFIEAAAWHVRPGGWLFFNVPALSALFSRYDTVAGHYRRYTRATLAAEIAAAGLTVVDLRYWGLSLLPLLIARNIMVKFAAEGDVIDRGFKPPASTINRGLDLLMSCEQKLVSRPLLGTSVLAAARRPA